MSQPQDLKSLYVDELRDLWSANDQMQRMVEDMADRAEDKRIAQGFAQSAKGIAQHTASLRKLLSSVAGDEKRDIVMLAQYQRMSHYGIAGFGTAAAYAKALGREQESAELKKMVKEIYSADDYASQFATQAEEAAAKADAVK
jgi:ferritin-like metal-binding protein YciE